MSANLSTGPRTEEGKAKSSQNARKHGLTAESIPADLRPVFNHLRNELHSQCRPDGPLEEIFFDKLVTARWNMLRALDFQNELYDRSDGRDPITHPTTQKEAELYSRYYIRFEGSFNRAYKQLKDSQTNRICQLIETNPDAPRPSLPLADALKIQRFAKRTPPSVTEPRPSGSAAPSDPRPSASAAPSEDILTHFPPSVAAEIRDDAANLDISVNFLISQYAKIGYQTALQESVRNEPNYDCVKR